MREGGGRQMNGRVGVILGRLPASGKFFLKAATAVRQGCLELSSLGVMVVVVVVLVMLVVVVFWLWWWVEGRPPFEEELGGGATSHIDPCCFLLPLLLLLLLLLVGKGSRVCWVAPRGVIWS